jgi:hypothetical protein
MSEIKIKSTLMNLPVMFNYPDIQPHLISLLICQLRH